MCFNANLNSCVLSDQCTFCTVWNKFGFCRQILWSFWHFRIFFENETFGSLQCSALFPSPRVPSLGKRGEGNKAAALEARLLADSSITDGSALVLHPSLQGTSSSNVPAPFGSQSLFLLVSLCEVVNSSFALRASAVEPAFFTSLDKLSHNGFFLPDEDGCSCTFLSAQSCSSNFVS